MDSCRQIPPAASINRATPSQRRAVAVVGPLLIVLGLWLSLLWAEGAFRSGPSGAGFGGDLAMFVGAAQVLRDGGNSYDPAAVYRAEYQLLHRQGLPVASERYVRVANPPLFYWILQPVTRFPYQLVAYTWMIGMYLLSALGFVAVVRSFGWRGWLLSCLIFLAMPEVVLGVYYGNVDGLIFAAIGCSLLLLGRWPVAAGASMSLVWLKPHVGIPIVMLLALFQPLYRRRMLVGFGVATCLLLALTVMVTGFHSLTLWVRGMENFSHGTGTYGDVASLAVPWAPAPALMVRLSLQVIGFSVASGLTIAWWWKCRRYDDVPVLAYAWLWPVWLLAAPFSHFHDEILLAIPVVALVGRDGSRAMRWPSVLALYLLVMSVVLLSVHPFHTQFVWVPLLGLSACLVAGAYAARAHYVSLPSGCLRSAH